MVKRGKSINENSVVCLLHDLICLAICHNWSAAQNSMRFAMLLNRYDIKTTKWMHDTVCALTCLNGTICSSSVLLVLFWTVMGTEISLKFVALNFISQDTLELTGNFIIRGAKKKLNWIGLLGMEWLFIVCRQIKMSINWRKNKTKCEYNLLFCQIPLKSLSMKFSKMELWACFCFLFFCVLFLFSSTTRTDTNVCHQSVARNGIHYETYLLGHGGSRYCLWSVCVLQIFCFMCFLF